MLYIIIFHDIFVSATNIRLSCTLSFFFLERQVYIVYPKSVIFLLGRSNYAHSTD